LGADELSGWLEMMVGLMVVLVVMRFCWLRWELMLWRVLGFSVSFGLDVPFGAIIGAALIPDEVVSVAVSSVRVWFGSGLG
jgi:hypothetical protein